LSRLIEGIPVIEPISGLLGTAFIPETGY